MHACMNVCMCACMYVCMHVFVCMHSYICVCGCVCVYVCMYVCVCVHIYVFFSTMSELHLMSSASGLTRSHGEGDPYRKSRPMDPPKTSCLREALVRNPHLVKLTSQSNSTTPYNPGCRPCCMAVNSIHLNPTQPIIQQREKRCHVNQVQSTQPLIQKDKKPYRSTMSGTPTSPPGIDTSSICVLSSPRAGSYTPP